VQSEEIQELEALELSAVAGGHLKLLSKLGQNLEISGASRR